MPTGSRPAVHILAAAFGLSVLLAAVPALYQVVKLAGAAYLVWMGLTLILDGSGLVPSARSSADGTPARPLRDSMIVELLNPKSALFHLAFLPQFTDPAAALPVWAQILVLGTVVNVMFSGTDAVCIWLSGSVSSLFMRSPRLARVARRLCGGVLAGLGIEMATSRT